MSIPCLHCPVVSASVPSASDRFLEERLRLRAPDPQPRRIDRRLQGLDRRRVEAPTKIAGRGRVGNALRPERVQVHLILPALLDILQARPAAEHVVRDPEHVIRFVIRQVDLQHLDVAIDRLDQPRVLRQAMHGADAAARQPADPIAVLILNVARRVHRPRLRVPRARFQPSGNPSFAPRQLLVSTRLHSKCPPRVRADWSPTATLLRGYGHFEHFAYSLSRKRACTGTRRQQSDFDVRSNLPHRVDNSAGHGLRCLPVHRHRP
jgi:hypothetical protein